MRNTPSFLGNNNPSHARLLGVCLMFLLCFRLSAQSDSARITGTVADSTGAALPGAIITVTNQQNNAVSKATSGGRGDFTVSALPPGTYKAQVVMAGFASAAQNFKLDVSQVQAINFKLSVGSENTVIEVNNAAPLVQTESSDTGTIINDRQLSDLPLNGRNFTQLALLAPGVTRGPAGNQASGVQNNTETLRYNDTGGASLSGNGLREQANNFLLDGLDNNEALVNTINFFPPVEAMSEFRVTNSLAPAEFGRAGGVIIQSAIKSGTNKIHGSAFMFYRDFALGGASENYFSPTVLEAHSHRNQFGGTIGGPILRDKLFLFFDYQGLREAIPNGGATINTVPTAKMRIGDFSELLGQGQTVVPYNSVGNFSPTGCASFTTVHGINVTSTAQLKASVDNGAIFDPLTCAQFGSVATPNVIPAARLNNPASKVAMNYLNAFPLPNHTANNGTLNNYANTQFIINRYNDFDARLDYHFKSKDTLFARYSYAQDNNQKTIAVVGVPSGFGAGFNNTHPRGVAAGDTHIFTPNLVNEVRFGYSRPEYGYSNPFENVPFSQNLGIVNANRNSTLGGGALIGASNGQISYTGDGGPYSVPQKSYQVLDTVSYNHGAHAMKFGANAIFRQVNFFQADYRSKGFFQYQNGGGDYTGYEVSEMLVGFVNTYSIANPLGSYNTRTYETGYFAQDDWKVTRRLTLNLGLRYDLYNFPYEANDRQSNFDIPSASLKVAGVNGNSRSLVNTPKTNFAPRIGFAYDVFGDGKTALRGGYGLYYFLDRGGVGNELSNNPDFNGASSYNDYSGYRVSFAGQGPKQPNTATPGPYLAANNIANASAALPSSAFSVNEAAPTNVAVISYSPTSRIPAIQQVNLSVQQQIEKNTTATITYVGTKADHLLTSVNYTAAQIGTGIQFFKAQGLSVTQNSFEGTSHYNGLQTSLNHRLVNGLQVTAAYTWSHNVDDSTGPFAYGPQAGVPITSAGPQLSLNRGNADSDQRHAATFSALIEVPYGRGRKYGTNLNKTVDYLIGGFQFSPFVSIGSGNPFDLTTIANGNVSTRPDLVGNPQTGLRKTFNNTGQFVYLNKDAFQDAPLNAQGITSRVGNVHRNQFYGPGYNTTGLSVFKAIPFTERIKSEIRGQAYNLFNHPQFSNPNQTNIDTTGITINSTRFRSARELELAYRVTF